MEIEKKIIQLRMHKGWSKYKLGQVSGISQSSLSRIESGKVKPGYDMLIKIANALGVSMAEFDDNPMPIVPASNLTEVEDQTSLPWERKAGWERIKTKREAEQHEQLDELLTEIKNLSFAARAALLVLIKEMKKK